MTTGTGDAASERRWKRTADQARLIVEHLDLIRTAYADVDPRLRALFTDTTVWGTPELIDAFGVTLPNSAHQWYTAGRRNDEAGKSPHPGGSPAPDASGGSAGPNEVHGIIAGRALFWGWQSGRLHWDPVRGRLVRNEHLNHGGRPAAAA